MPDRLTDAELDQVEDWAARATAAEVRALVAEVREHRAARTLTDEERDAVEWLRPFIEIEDPAPPMPKEAQR